jgi:hypothetical protein
MGLNDGGAVRIVIRKYLKIGKRCTCYDPEILIYAEHAESPKFLATKSSTNQFNE